MWQTKNWVCCLRATQVPCMVADKDFSVMLHLKSDNEIHYWSWVSVVCHGRSTNTELSKTSWFETLQGWRECNRIRAGANKRQTKKKKKSTKVASHFTVSNSSEANCSEGNGGHKMLRGSNPNVWLGRPSIWKPTWQWHATSLMKKTNSALPCSGCNISQRSIQKKACLQGNVELMEEWGIRDKVKCLVTDGAPNVRPKCLTAECALHIQSASLFESHLMMSVD